jgi:uncharacterized membrane protein
MAMEVRGNGSSRQHETRVYRRPEEHEEHFTPAGTVTGQMRALLKDASTLVSQEIALARAEIGEKAQQAKKGAGYLGAAAGLGFAGLLTLCASIMWLLAIVMPLWIASLIVAAVLLIAAGLLFSAGKKNMEPSNLTPDRTMQSLKRDRRLVQEHLP